MIASPGFSSTSIDRWFSRIKPGVALFVAMTLGGCQSGSSDGRELLQVHAASSLTNAFEQLAQAFENAHSGIDVSLVFSGSQVLRLQIEQGLVTDVLATANQQHIDSLVSSGLVKKSLVFARNELVLVVPGDNPAAIESFVDLPRSSRFVIGSKQVPVGSYTDQMLTRSGQHLGLDFEQRCRSRVVSRENNVRLVRAKVELGEADAAIIYRTDTTSFDRVRSIAIPEQINVKAEYFLGELSATRHQKLAGEWITFVLSAEGQKILAQHGFVEG